MPSHISVETLSLGGTDPALPGGAVVQALLRDPVGLALPRRHYRPVQGLFRRGQPGGAIEYASNWALLVVDVLYCSLLNQT